MPENSMLGTIVTAISVSTAALAVVAWLVRSIISHWLAKDVEQFKMSLKHEKELEIERLKVELNRIAAEDQIKFKQLHTKVFVSIARLHRLIVATQMAMNAYLSPVTFTNSPSEEDREKNAKEAWSALNGFFRLHEIYFDKQTCRVLGDYLSGLYDLMVKFQERQGANNYAREWLEVWQRLNTDMEKLKRELEDSFRKKIGVEV